MQLQNSSMRRTVLETCAEIGKLESEVLHLGDVQLYPPQKDEKLQTVV